MASPPSTIQLSELEGLSDQRVRWIPLAIPRVYYPPALTREASELDLVSSLRKLLNNTSTVTAARGQTKMRELVAGISSREELADLVQVAVGVTASGAPEYVVPYLQVFSGASGQRVCGQKWSEEIISQVGRLATRGYGREQIRELAEINLHGVPEMDLEDSEELYCSRAAELRQLTRIVAEIYRGSAPGIVVNPGALYTFYTSQLDRYTRLVGEMKELGDPYTGECQDTEEWSVLEAMKNLYEDSLLDTMSLVGVGLRRDTRSSGGRSLRMIVSRFSDEVVPHISRGWCRRKVAEMTLDG